MCVILFSVIFAVQSYYAIIVDTLNRTAIYLNSEYFHIFTKIYISNSFGT